MSAHVGYGIRTFKKQMTEDLSKRLDRFVLYMETQKKDDLDSLGSRSKQDWLIAFKKWSEEANDGTN